MSIYHLCIKIISRSSGKSAVAASAYRAGDILEDQEMGIIQDYSRKTGVVMSQIDLPKNAPERFTNREILWNEVQRVEKNANSQLAREVEVALPVEMSRDEQLECLRDFIDENFVSKGMIADWALHDKEVENPNPHAHILLTVRGFTEDGKWDRKKRSEYILDEDGNKVPEIDLETGKQKVRIREGKGIEKIWKRIYIPANDWSNRSKAEEWRKSWAEHCNRYLLPDDQIDHRSYERQGIDRIPTIHEGVVARKMEQQGKDADRCEINRNIRIHNLVLDSIKKMTSDIISRVRKKVNKIHEKIDELIGLFSGNRGYHYEHTRGPGYSDRYDRGSGETDRQTEEGEQTAEELVESVDRSEQRLRNSERISDGASWYIDIASDEIDRLEAIVRVKEEQNARYQRILERRRSAESDGDTAGRDRESEVVSQRTREGMGEPEVGLSVEDTKSFIQQQLAKRTGSDRHGRHQEQGSADQPANFLYDSPKQEYAESPGTIQPEISRSREGSGRVR